MEIKAMEAAVEALLFAMGEAIPAADIAQVLEIDTEEARKLIRNMMTHYDEEDRDVYKAVHVRLSDQNDPSA